MGTQTIVASYELSRVDEHHWLIHDHSASPHDAAHLVACIHIAGEDDVEVLWLRDVPLPTRYATAGDVLDDLVMWTTRSRGGSRPVPIPARPPVGAD